jgi:hypothetical protein
VVVLLALVGCGGGEPPTDFGTGDVRPMPADPCNFNPSSTTPGSLVEDAARDGDRDVSVLIGDYGHGDYDVPYVSYEVEYLRAAPGCTGTGYKGSQASMAARLDLGAADVVDTTALHRNVDEITEHRHRTRADVSWLATCWGPDGHREGGRRA